MHLEDDHTLKSGVVLSTRKPKDITLVKAFLGILAVVDNPTPAGKAASFVSFTGSKVYVEFEIIATRLRRRVLEAVTRERHGDDGVRVLRLLLDCGKADEKQVCVYLSLSYTCMFKGHLQVSKLAMIAPRDVRPLLSAMSAESLISIQEVPKSADRNPTRMFYLWSALINTSSFRTSLPIRAMHTGMWICPRRAPCSWETYTRPCIMST